VALASAHSVKKERERVRVDEKERWACLHNRSHYRESDGERWREMESEKRQRLHTEGIER
jgi:hypothetical protein